MEERARNCYEGTINMSSAKFVTMMVLDGLFVVELLRRFKDHKLREVNDGFLKRKSNLIIIAQDLLLLENQLPFFVLYHFFVKTKLSPSEESLEDAAIHFFSMMVPDIGMQDDGGRPCIQDIKHLLGLVHNYFLSSPQPGQLSIPLKSDIKFDQWEMDRLLDPSFIRSATELAEVGIRFKKQKGNNLFDIKFKRVQLHIPTLIVDHDTERIFRNLIAYEQLNHGSSIVMDYARLMDCLINHADGVALLSDCGIIDNRLGTNEEVANMFNKLNDYVYLSTANFYYTQLFYDVNEHCNRPWNVWKVKVNMRMAQLNLWKVKLSQKYHNRPWDWVLASILVAAILLLLTFLQTLYSVLSYYRK
ncbi:hypothetical protein PTKIN_Ptkin06aG0184200 [Pterospermum kingtungense]